MTRSRLLLLLSIGPATAAVACASLYGVTDVPPVADGGTASEAGRDAPAMADAPADAPHEAGTDGGTSCPALGWPARPLPTTSDAGDVPPFVLAARDVDLNPAHPIGLNLDGVCTCPGPSSCALPANARSMADCDNPQGVDLVLNRALLQFQNFVCVPLAQSIAVGYSNIVLRIAGYDGQADDDTLTVELFVSMGTKPMDDAGTPTPPAYDGRDVWIPWDRFLSQGSTIYTDLNAYVADHVLVAKPSDRNGATVLTWRLAPSLCDGGLVPPLVGPNPLGIVGTGVVLSGELVEDADGGFALQNATAGARVATDGPEGFLGALNLFGLCPDNPNDLRYQTAKSDVCPDRDIASLPKNDNTSPPSACNAVSFAVGFNATAAILGPPGSLQTVPPCDPDASPSCGP